MNLKEIASVMKHIDICMMGTIGPRGIVESRPMSNNRQVEYDGDSYFFTRQNYAVAKEISKNNNVSLSFSGHHSLLNRTSVYIAITGKAKLVSDKAEMLKHWDKSLDIWFKKGVDTPGVVMIKVKASNIRYWDGMQEGVIKPAAKKRK